jgi:hypothetical protein
MESSRPKDRKAHDLDVLPRDAEDWSRRTEDEMVRGAYIQRAAADRMTVADALKRYLADVTPTKRPMSQTSDQGHAKPLTKSLGRYSLAALTPELIARYRDARLSGEDREDKEGNPIPRAANTVRLDLAIARYFQPPTGDEGFNAQRR